MKGKRKAIPDLAYYMPKEFQKAEATTRICRQSGY